MRSFLRGLNASLPDKIIFILNLLNFVRFSVYSVLWRLIYFCFFKLAMRTIRYADLFLIYHLIAFYELIFAPMSLIYELMLVLPHLIEHHFYMLIVDVLSYFKDRLFHRVLLSVAAWLF